MTDVSEVPQISEIARIKAIKLAETVNSYWNRRAISNKIAMVLSVFGTLLAGALTIEEFLPSPLLPCGGQGVDCQTDFHSAYGHLGPIPTAMFGLAMYITVLVLCIRRTKSIFQTSESQPEVRKSVRKFDGVVFLITLLAFVISWWLQYVAIFVVHSFCPYCFTSAITVSLLFMLSIHDYLLFEKELGGEQKMVLGIIAAMVAVMMVFWIPQIHLIIEEQAKVQAEEQPHSQPISLRKVVLDGGHAEGNLTSKYVVVEFADYGCPYCHKASDMIPGLLKKYPDIKFVFRNFPLGMNMPQGPLHPGAVTAADAAEAAALQGKFWQMHDALYKIQAQIMDHPLSVDQCDTIAQSLGLDINKFNTDLQSKQVQQIVGNDFQDGSQAMGDKPMTPTFYIVTPDKVTSLIGPDVLKKTLANRKSSVWK